MWHVEFDENCFNETFPLSNIDVSTTAFEGFCPSGDCDAMFYMTMVFVGFVSLLASTARVGNSIINLRAVEPRDKSASITILISALSLFALFPSPLIYGALMGKINGFEKEFSRLYLLVTRFILKP